MPAGSRLKITLMFNDDGKNYSLDFKSPPLLELARDVSVKITDRMSTLARRTDAVWADRRGQPLAPHFSLMAYCGGTPENAQQAIDDVTAAFPQLAFEPCPVDQQSGVRELWIRVPLQEAYEMTREK